MEQVPLKEVPCCLSLAQGVAVTICGGQTPVGTGISCKGVAEETQSNIR